jgi:hypothetical protein
MSTVVEVFDHLGQRLIASNCYAEIECLWSLMTAVSAYAAEVEESTDMTRIQYTITIECEDEDEGAEVTSLMLDMLDTLNGPGINVVYVYDGTTRDDY